MTIIEFKEKAIKGGWKNDFWEVLLPEQRLIEIVLLDPLAWQAVGKVEGYDEKMDVTDWIDEGVGKAFYGDRAFPTHIYQMHRMIDALAEGKRISEFLETL